MTKPIDRQQLLDELWDYAESPKENDPQLKGRFRHFKEYRDRLKQIPPETRKALEDAWRAQRKEIPRYRDNDDGTIGLFVTDHLYIAFRLVVCSDDGDEGPFYPHELSGQIGWSDEYAQTLCNALG